MSGNVNDVIARKVDKKSVVQESLGVCRIGKKEMTKLRRQFDECVRLIALRLERDGRKVLNTKVAKRAFEVGRKLELTENEIEGRIWGAISE